jgi:anti-anti-sigma factor
MVSVNVRLRDDVAVLSVDGPIDGSDSCRKIHEVIKENLDAGRKKFVMDLQRVGWINSLGVGFLAAAAVSACQAGAVVRVAGLTSRVGAVLRACRVVPHVLREFPDEKTATASF